MPAPTSSLSLNEPIACLCGAERAACIRKGRFIRLQFVDHPYPYSLWRCLDCGLVQTVPCPGDGDPVSIYQGYGEHLIGLEDEARRYYRPRVADLGRWATPPARVLDVGCNIGTMVGLLGDAGYAAEGIDVDQGSIAYGRSLGRKLWATELRPPEEISAGPQGNFDVVMISHTLEHVREGNGLIRNAVRHLRPGGVLMIYVPNFASFAAQLLRGRWLYLVPHQHVWQFTPRTLRTAVERAAPELGCVWIRGNTRMESDDAATWWKRAIRFSALEIGARLGYGDEIRAVFRRA